MEDLKTYLIQTDVAWNDVNANLEKLGNICKTLKNPDLIVLPEMFSTGYNTLEPEIAEETDGQTTKWLKETSKNLKTAITGSIACKDGGKYFNRQLFAVNGDITAFYDKRHLFTLAKENLHYTPGNKRVIFELKGWRLLPQICFDLRFPIFSKNSGEYDVAIYSANWPAMRIKHWEVLLQARAIENQSFVLGCNRVGIDKEGINYNGNSAIIDPTGKVLAHAMEKEFVLDFTLRRSVLEQTRDSFPFLTESDRYKLIL